MSCGGSWVGILRRRSGGCRKERRRFLFRGLFGMWYNRLPYGRGSVTKVRTATVRESVGRYLHNASRNQIMQDCSGYICQPEIAAAVAICQLGMIDPHQMQDRRVHIVHMYRLLYRFETEVVRGAVDGPAFHAATRHPHRESERVVIAAGADRACAAADFPNRCS